MPNGALARRDKQIVRVIALLRILKEGGRPTVYTLAERFNTRRETIYRDLRVLQQAGYPIVGDSQGRLSRPALSADFLAAPPPSFSKQELAALTWAAKQAGSRQPFRAGLDGALLKLQGIAVGSDAQLARNLVGVFDGWTRGVKDYTPFEGTILHLVEAIVARQRCRVTYQAPYRADSRTYEYDPYRLLAVHGGLYCLGRIPPGKAVPWRYQMSSGYSPQGSAPKPGTQYAKTVTLAIHRIKAVETTEESFTIDRSVDIDRYKAEAFGVVWERPITVALRFQPDRAPYVREREWHPTQRLRDLRDGRLELIFRAGGTFEITRWILSWGDAVEVVRPASLRREVAVIHRQAARQYR